MIIQNGKPAYERTFAEFLGSGVQAFAFWKGRVALYAILKALGTRPGDEIIVPGFTCVAVANAVQFAGARPVYADIGSNDFNLDPSSMEDAITPRTIAVIVQHTFGIPARVQALIRVAEDRGIAVIEDCAHAFGTQANGEHVGMAGKAAFFSSQWSKPYTTGLGGIAVTRENELAGELHRLQKSFNKPPQTSRFRLRLQYHIFEKLFTPRLYWTGKRLLQVLGRTGLFIGSSSVPELEGHMPVDHHWQMASFQLSTGMRKLDLARSQLSHRNSLAVFYDLAFSNSSWPSCKRPEGSVLLRYPVRVGNKSALLDRARRAGVEIGDWFVSPLHPLPLHEHYRLDYKSGLCPNGEKAANEVVNLPLHRRVTQRDANRILSFFFSNAILPQ